MGGNTRGKPSIFATLTTNDPGGMFQYICDKLNRSSYLTVKCRTIRLAAKKTRNNINFEIQIKK